MARTAILLLITCLSWGCASVERSEHKFTIQIEFDDATKTVVGDTAKVTVSRDFDQLTGYLDPIFGGLSLESELDFRLEQDATWLPMNTTYTCP